MQLFHIIYLRFENISYICTVIWHLKSICGHRLDSCMSFGKVWVTRISRKTYSTFIFTIVRRTFHHENYKPSKMTATKRLRDVIFASRFFLALLCLNRIEVLQIHIHVGYHRCLSRWLRHVERPGERGKQRCCPRFSFMECLFFRF